MITNIQTSHRQSSIKIGYRTLVAILLLTFISVTHLPILSDSARDGLMVICILGSAVFAFLRLGVKRKGISRSMALVLLAAFLILSFSLHNFLYPALTDYASNKRLLFPIIFLSSFVIFPLALSSYDVNSKALIKYLILFSLLFALLAFVAPTGSNIRRSGIELNPAMHSKLLFFPFFLLIAQKSRSPNQILLIAAVILCIIATLKTGSRTPFAAVIIVLFLDTIVNANLKNLIRFFAYCILIFTTVFFLLDYLPSGISDRFKIEEMVSQSDEGDRLFLYFFAINLISQNPFGIGMGNMSSYFWVNAPHNIILELFVDFGLFFPIPMVLLFLYTSLVALKALRRKETEFRFLAIWYLSFFLYGLTGGELTFPSLLLYIPMGLLLLMKFDKNRPPLRRA